MFFVHIVMSDPLCLSDSSADAEPSHFKHSDAHDRNNGMSEIFNTDAGGKDTDGINFFDSFQKNEPQVGIFIMFYGC